MRLSNRNFTVRREKPRGRHLPPSKQRRSGPRESPRGRSSDRHAPLDTTFQVDQQETPPEPGTRETPRDPDTSYLDQGNFNQNGAFPALDRPHHPASRDNSRRMSPNGTVTHSFSTAVPVDVLPREETEQKYNLTEAAIHHMWNTPEPHLSLPSLQPHSSHTLRQMTARRSRTGIWTTLTLAVIVAVLTAGALVVFGGAEQAELHMAVRNSASIAAGSVNDSLATLDSLRGGSSFTPELVASISELGAASRGLVESAAGLPTNDSSLAEVRMSATALAGRISRLGETFGAAFAYRGKIAPHLMPPSLTDPLEIANLADNATLLTAWQSQLEQAAATPPSQPRLLQNHQALEATLPYISVHRQAYSDAIGNGQPEQATAALSQIASLLLAIGQDLDRAISEIAEMSTSEIQSLRVDLQSLSAGT